MEQGILCPLDGNPINSTVKVLVPRRAQGQAAENVPASSGGTPACPVKLPPPSASSVEPARGGQRSGHRGVRRRCPRPGTGARAARHQCTKQVNTKVSGAAAPPVCQGVQHHGAGQVRHRRVPRKWSRGVKRSCPAQVPRSAAPGRRAGETPEGAKQVDTEVSVKLPRPGARSAPGSWAGGTP